MSKIALALKINLSEIDMSRIFQGKKGQYLDATIFVDMAELDQYGNSGMITQDVSKDEKAQGVKGKILGNGKVFWVEGGQAPQQAGQLSTNTPSTPPSLAPVLTSALVRVRVRVRVRARARVRVWLGLGFG